MIKIAHSNDASLGFIVANWRCGVNSTLMDDRLVPLSFMLLLLMDSARRAWAQL